MREMDYGGRKFKSDNKNYCKKETESIFIAVPGVFAGGYRH